MTIVTAKSFLPKYSTVHKVFSGISRSPTCCPHLTVLMDESVMLGAQRPGESYAGSTEPGAVDWRSSLAWKGPLARVSCCTLLCR